MAKGPERLVRWIMGHTQPVPYSLDIEHPAMDDIAWAADEIERLQAELRAASRNPTLALESRDVEAPDAGDALRRVLNDPEAMERVMDRATEAQRETLRVGRIKFGPLYADRDPSKLEPWYSQHVNAMTAEGLHSKSDIAAELAHRDRQIRELSDALTWTAQRLRDVLACRPVRDATECLANADRLTGSNRLSCMNQDSGNE